MKIRFSKVLHRYLVMFVLGVSGCVTANPADRTEVFILRARVQDIVPLAGFAGTVKQVDVDPRFVLSLYIESVSPTISGLTSNSPVVFAIHSPTRLFGVEDPKGMTYDFVLSRETTDGKTRYFGMAVKKTK